MHVNYICKDAPELSLRIRDEPEIVLQFSNKKLTLDPSKEEDAEKIKILDGLIANKPNINQLIRKSSIEDAHKIALEHKMRVDRQKGISKGGMNTGHLMAMVTPEEKQGYIAKLMADGASQEDAEKMFTEMQEVALPTETVEGQPVTSPMEGVTLNAEETARRQSVSARSAPVEGDRSVIQQVAHPGATVPKTAAARVGINLVGLKKST